MAIAAAEPIAITNAHQSTLMITSNNTTGTLNLPELSELTPLPEETTEPPMEDSMVSTGTENSEIMNSPLSRVENELSDSDVVENALRDSSLQVKVEEVTIPY